MSSTILGIFVNAYVPRVFVGRPQTYLFFFFCRSHHQCEVTVYGLGRMDSSQCTETHEFKPFSSATSGVMTTTTQSLKLISESSYASPVELEDSSVSTLLFNPNVQAMESQDQDDQQTQLILDQLTSTTHEDKTRVELFTQLVHSMRTLSHSQLVRIYQHEEQLEGVLLDALPLLKTDAAMTLMRDLVETGQVSGMSGSPGKPNQRITNI